jgi:hypothetical protein
LNGEWVGEKKVLLREIAEPHRLKWEKAKDGADDKCESDVRCLPCVELLKHPTFPNTETTQS